MIINWLLLQSQRLNQTLPPSLFIFSHDFRRIIKTRRGDAARRPNGGSIPFCTPSLCLRRKRAQTTYIFATTVEVKLQVMEEPPPFGPAQHLPAGSGKRLPGPDGRVNLPLSSPSRPGSVNQSKFIHLLKSEGGLFVLATPQFSFLDLGREGAGGRAFPHPEQGTYPLW